MNRGKHTKSNDIRALSQIIRKPVWYRIKLKLIYRTILFMSNSIILVFNFSINKLSRNYILLYYRDLFSFKNQTFWNAGFSERYVSTGISTISRLAVKLLTIILTLIYSYLRLKSANFKKYSSDYCHIWIESEVKGFGIE